RLLEKELSVTFERSQGIAKLMGKHARHFPECCEAPIPLELLMQSVPIPERTPERERKSNEEDGRSDAEPKRTTRLSAELSSEHGLKLDHEQRSHSTASQRSRTPRDCIFPWMSSWKRQDGANPVTHAHASRLGPYQFHGRNDRCANSKD